MKRYLILVAIFMMASGLVVSCAPDLPDEEQQLYYSTGFTEGHSWGYRLAAENSQVWWITPDRIDKVAKTNPEVTDWYIPKGYWTIEDIANAHFPNGTPYNEKQKKQIVEGYNWGFYNGFRQGCDDFLAGKPPLPVR